MKAEVWNFSQFNTSKLFFFHNSSLWSQQLQFPLNAWDSDSQTFSEDRNPRCFWGWGICEKFILSIKRLVSKQILGRGESLLCLAGQWQPGTDTQAADSTQIPSVRRFHLDLAETSVVFSWDIPSFLTVLPLSQGPLAAGFPVSQQWRWLSCLKGVGCSLLSTVVWNCLVGICIKGQTLRKLPSRPQ